MTDFEDEFNEIAKGLAEELQSNPPNQRNFNPPMEEIAVRDLNSDTTIEEYINTSAQKSNEILNQVLARLAPDVGDDPERIDAFAKLIKSNTEILKIFNDQLINNRNNQTKIVIAKMKHDGSMKDVIENEESVVSSRDDMFRHLIKNAKITEFEEGEGQELT